VSHEESPARDSKIAQGLKTTPHPHERNRKEEKKIASKTALNLTIVVEA
jgi:hypothetical protein